MRTQTDGRGLEYSRKTMLETDPATDTTRQEFKDEADVNFILKKFNYRGPVPVAFPHQYPAPGDVPEVDFTIDLQTAIHARNDALAAFSRLPKNLRERYPSVDALMGAIQRGELVINTEEPEAPPTPPVVPPAPG